MVKSAEQVKMMYKTNPYINLNGAGNFGAKVRSNCNRIMDEKMLSVKNVALCFKAQSVLSDISFDVYKGELVTIVGPSGAGKSSLLNLIAGFLKPSQGEIRISRRVVSTPDCSLPPEKRDIGMVFQSHALLPQLRVWQNVSFPLERRKMKNAEAYAKATLRALGMETFLDRYPDELSGGQQRVGLARALVTNASLYLFDEPTANLDSENRQSFSREVRRRQRETGIACVYVTHHIEEAFEIADRVMVLINGSLKQIGSPEEIYERPNSLEVASLVGKYFTFEAIVCGQGEGQDFQVSVEHVKYRMNLTCASGAPAGPVQILCRPEWCVVGQKGIVGTVELVRYQGALMEYDVNSSVGQVLICDFGSPKYCVGDELYWLPRKGVVI